MLFPYQLQVIDAYYFILFFTKADEYHSSYVDGYLGEHGVQQEEASMEETASEELQGVEEEVARGCRVLDTDEVCGEAPHTACC